MSLPSLKSQYFFGIGRIFANQIFSSYLKSLRCQEIYLEVFFLLIIPSLLDKSHRQVAFGSLALASAKNYIILIFCKPNISYIIRNT